jgi:predicted nucleic acid-binding protein
LIAADTSSLIAFFSGATGSDVDQVRAALAASQICLPPVVLTELLSDAASQNILEATLAAWPVLNLSDGYWIRAGKMRSRLIARRLSPKVPDTLIAQSCIDHNVALITRDTDFRHFAKHCGLKLA